MTVAEFFKDPSVLLVDFADTCPHYSHNNKCDVCFFDSKGGCVHPLWIRDNSKEDEPDIVSNPLYIEASEFLQKYHPELFV